MKYVPSKTIEDAWSYISLEGYDIVLGVKQTVTKVMALTDNDGKPIIGFDSLPQFSIQNQTIIKAMTKEDWIAEKKSRGIGER